MTRLKIELVLGVVAPIGTDLVAVAAVVEDFFASSQYRFQEIRISDWFDLGERANEVGVGRFEATMDAGDMLREQSQRKDAVAAIAVAQVGNLRESREEERTEKAAESTIVFVRQIKTPEEITSLRAIYGNRLLILSCHSTRRHRVSRLARTLADGASELQANQFRSQAEHLIQRDEEDRASRWGQNVGKAFPMADVFVSTDDSTRMRSSLNRALEIVLGHPYHTPTRDEYGMQLAEAAALRSCALGRQVGAVITTAEGDVVSVGANEVPRAEGGLYWEGDNPDKRDFTLGYDSNDLFKRRLIYQLVHNLQEAKVLAAEWLERPTDDVVQFLIEGKESVLGKTQINNIIEFGRCVHAEMAAIVDAARRGVTVNGGILFTTTFPCHECARHIVAAGIRRVVYRVPYPKSLVRELYPDSIDVDGEIGENTSVRFEPFVGVAPRKYRQFFEMPARKQPNGRTIEWRRQDAKLNLGDFFPTHEIIKASESAFVREFWRFFNG